MKTDWESVEISHITFICEKCKICIMGWSLAFESQDLEKDFEETHKDHNPIVVTNRQTNQLLARKRML